MGMTSLGLHVRLRLLVISSPSTRVSRFGFLDLSFQVGIPHFILGYLDHCPHFEVASHSLDTGYMFLGESRHERRFVR
jgi:hypothetical protein